MKFSSLLLAAALTLIAGAAQAEMIHCARIVDGMCDTGPNGYHRPQIAPRFFNERRVAYGASSYETERHVVRHREHLRCRIGVYVAEVGACVAHAGPTADIPNDPACKGKPSGFRFDRAITGPHGERGVDHRVCR